MQVGGSLLNTGRDLRVILDEPSFSHGVNITGGPLSYQYRITEILLHFGSISSLGSEHTIAGVSFPAEVFISSSVTTKYSKHICINSRPNQCLLPPPRVNTRYRRGPEIKNGLRDPDHAPFKDHLSSVCWDFT